MTVYSDITPSNLPYIAPPVPEWLPEGYDQLSGIVPLLHDHFISQGDSERLTILQAAVLDQWPTAALDDPSLIAYTRNADTRDRGVRTKVRPGAWIGKIFPDVFGGRAMDALVAAHRSADDDLSYLTTTADIVEHMRGARSRGEGFGACMTACFSDPHPYSVYSTDLGWKLALLYRGDDVIARALVNDGEYVRVYGTSSNTIAAMEDRLKREGIEYTRGWFGRRIKAIHTGDDELVGPYIDGEATCGEFDGGTIVLDADGEIEFRETSGLAEWDGHRGQVQTAGGDWIDEDDAVTLHNGRVVHQDDAVWVDGMDEYYPADDVVELAKGGYWPADDAVQIGEEWHASGDPDIVEDYRGECILRDDAVTLDDGRAAHVDDTRLLADGATYVLDADACQVGHDWYRIADCVLLMAADGHYRWTLRAEVAV